MFKRLLTALLVVAVLLSSSAVTASAMSYTVGSSYTGLGTIVTNTTTTPTTGLEYSNTTYLDANGYGQTMYSMEFNPKTSGLIPIMYQPKPSYGSTVGNTVTAAKAKGYDVVGAINGEFFSMNTGNYGTLESRLISNGRILADSEDRNDVCLALDSDGNFTLVKSQLAYHFYIEGKEVLNAESGAPVIGCINKRYVGTNWWSPYCYFDYATGGKTYTNSSVPGVEVVFNKTDGTELMVENVLQGEVVSVNTNAYATTMTENQFVLYAQNGSSNYSALANLKAGQKVQIYVEELNKDAKAVMKNAQSVTAATYPIVMDGKSNLQNTPNATDIYLTRAQRTGIGVKEDGSIVVFCTKGRGASDTYDKGITLPEMAQLLIGMGCKYAVNLDGGGSSTFYVDGKTVFTAGREVGSSLLICKRNSATTSATAKTELNTWITKATNTTFAGEQKAKVEAALTEAKAVYNDTNAKTGSMTADFLREKVDLQTAMGVVKSFAPKDYISLNVADWSYNTALVSAKNTSAGALVFNNLNGQWPTITYACDLDVLGDYKFHYDFTANHQVSFQIKIDGKDVKLNDLIAPASDIDSGSGDIKASGKTYKGTIDVSKIKAGGFNLSAITVWTIGAAGNGSQVTLRDFAFRNPYANGDMNVSGAVNSSDARMMLLFLSGNGTLNASQQEGADMTGDSKVDTNDIRRLLIKRVGLA